MSLRKEVAKLQEKYYALSYRVSNLERLVEGYTPNPAIELGEPQPGLHSRVTILEKHLRLTAHRRIPAEPAYWDGVFE